MNVSGQNSYLLLYLCNELNILNSLVRQRKISRRRINNFGPDKTGPCLGVVTTEADDLCTDGKLRLSASHRILLI